MLYLIFNTNYHKQKSYPYAPSTTINSIVYTTYLISCNIDFIN